MNRVRLMAVYFILLSLVGLSRQDAAGTIKQAVGGVFALIKQPAIAALLVPLQTIENIMLAVSNKLPVYADKINDLAEKLLNTVGADDFNLTCDENESINIVLPEILNLGACAQDNFDLCSEPQYLTDKVFNIVVCVAGQVVWLVGKLGLTNAQGLLVQILTPVFLWLFATLIILNPTLTAAYGLLAINSG